jgi:hypothetical protein
MFFTPYASHKQLLTGVRYIHKPIVTQPRRQDVPSYCKLRLQEEKKELEDTIDASRHSHLPS